MRISYYFLVRSRLRHSHHRYLPCSFSFLKQPSSLPSSDHTHTQQQLPHPPNTNTNNSSSSSSSSKLQGFSAAPLTSRRFFLLVFDAHRHLHNYNYSSHCSTFPSLSLSLSLKYWVY